ncbi:AMP-binding protein [Aromatoleum bremense]|uniref:AMP-binding protein n=2 Tax=Aromatoleum bremense TaxID=76115 RepID=A0ABX1NU31_9RHOO|nr:AMP-binding protein [Aromatoleum bremense]
MTLPEAFAARVRATPSADAYIQHDAASGVWRTWSWAAIGAEMERWRRALAAKSIPAGERVAVMLPNCIEWVCFEQAALALGLVVVPLYLTDNPGNSAHVLADSGACLLLLDSAGQWMRLRPLRAGFPILQRVLCLQHRPGELDDSDRTLIGCEQWLAAHEGSPPPPPGTSGAAALATLIYTSGTTGPAKGVMLSHANILSNALAVLEVVPVVPADRFLSFLPLSHAFERTVGYYIPMLAGACVAFARSLQDLPEDLVGIKPTALTSVPRIYERMFSRIECELAQRGPIARTVFHRAEMAGWRRFVASQPWGDGRAMFARLEWALAGRHLARKIAARLGGHVRVAVSGGAPLALPVARRLLALGVPLIQGYGLTEAAPVVSANRLDDNLPESVGRPLPGVEIKLDAGGELLVRGPNVMMGYWNNPTATAAAVDGEGWLHTRDLARIEDGRVFIHGRVKEIIVMSTGEKVSPSDMEAALAGDAMFEQTLIVGERRPFLVALLVLNPVIWRSLARTRAIADPDDPAALRERAVLSAICDQVNHRLAGFPVWGRVRRVHLTLAPWTIESGLVTPTMKPKRRELEQRFAEEIAALYRHRAI